MCRSSVMIRWASFFRSPNSSAINRTFKRQCLSRTAFTRATLLTFLAVEGRPARCSSPTLSLPSLNALCHLNTCAEHKTASSISRPEQLRRFGTRFSEFRAELDGVTLLQTLLHFARDKTQELLRALLTYRLLHRRGLNCGRSNFIPGSPLHLPRPPLSFPGPSALRKKK